MRPIYIITGLIGSGKSTVSNYFKYRHFEVIKLDEFAKKTINENSTIKCMLIGLFGKDIITSDCLVDFKKLKSFYLDNTGIYEDNLSIFEQKLDNVIIEKIKKMKDSEEPLFLEMASVNVDRFTKYMEELTVNQIIFVDASYNIRHERLKKNRGMTDEQIKLFENKQNTFNFFQTMYKSFSNKIENNGTEKDLFDNVTKFLQNNINMSMENRLAVFMKMYDEAPYFVREKIACSLFKTATGCAGCPFPCEDQNKQIEK